MKKYQIAIIAFFGLSAFISLLQNKPAGYIASAVIVVVLVVVWRKKNTPQQPPEFVPGIVDKPTDIPAAVESVQENFIVAGTQYHLDELLELSYENPVFDYSKRELIDNGYEDERIYEYEFEACKVELIEEPDNPHDPNAVKVVIDGRHVGYIKSGSCSHVKKLLHSGNVISISADVYGGKYKLLYQDDDEQYCIETNESPFDVKVSIIRRK